jgi:hypothetical protein
VPRKSKHPLLTGHISKNGARPPVYQLHAINLRSDSERKRCQNVNLLFAKLILVILNCFEIKRDNDLLWGRALGRFLNHCKFAK